MARYDYECPTCKTIKTITHSINDASKHECEICGGELRKKLSAPGIAFKGNGFYTNDKFL